MENNKTIQYWNNGIMRTLVTEEEAKEIMNAARKLGHKVFDNGTYFVVEK